MIFWVAVIALVMAAVWAQSAAAYSKAAVKELETVKQELRTLQRLIVHLKD